MFRGILQNTNSHNVVELAGLEPATPCTPSRCATRLRYSSLPTTIGMVGIEPTTLRSQSECATAALHPDAVTPERLELSFPT